MNARPARIILNAVLALATAACNSAESGPTAVDHVTGTLSVGVTGPGSSDFVITVLLSGPEGFAHRTASMRLGDTSTFTALEPGTYTVGTTILGLDCQSVSAEVQGDRETTVSIACTRKATPATGFVIAIVSAGDLPIEAASVELAAPGMVLSRHTAANGHLSFVGVPTGEYTLSTLHQHFNCPVQTIHVDADQRTTARISCTPKTTGAITGIVHASNLGAVFHLTGPVNRTATPSTTSSGASFAFDELPPGTYTVTATVPFNTCASVSAHVHSARTTTVEITCTSRLPIGSELAGDWAFYRSPRSQTGICPVSLPGAGTGSIEFSSSDGTVQIVGLDLELHIVGRYDPVSGVYVGSGAAVLGDGSTIQSDVILYFYWDYWDSGGIAFATDVETLSVWTRQHLDSGGNLVCTETYEAYGWPAN